MAKLSEKYETMAVFSLKNGEEQAQANKAKFSALISENAELIEIAEWGKRQLAYPINYETEGYYVLYNYDSKPDFPKELERILNITDGVLRFLTVLRRDIPTPKAPPAEIREAAESSESESGVSGQAPEAETDE